ncbi:hypothetical protein ACTXT7_016199 [Hymenolepis weldensis]
MFKTELEPIDKISMSVAQGRRTSPLFRDAQFTSHSLGSLNKTTISPAVGGPSTVNDTKLIRLAHENFKPNYAEKYCLMVPCRHKYSSIWLLSATD